MENVRIQQQLQCTRAPPWLHEALAQGCNQVAGDHVHVPGFRSECRTTVRLRLAVSAALGLVRSGYGAHAAPCDLVLARLCDHTVPLGFHA